MGKRLVLKNVRFSYFNGFEPREGENADDVPKYSTAILLTKDHPQIKDIEAAIKSVREEQWPDVKKRPAGLKSPLRDADAEAEKEGGEPKDGYAGCYFMSANRLAKFGKPDIIDASLNPADPDLWGSGDYGNVSVEFYPMVHEKNKGVACGLGNVQFVRKGKALGRENIKAANEFEVEEIPMDDAA